MMMRYLTNGCMATRLPDRECRTMGKEGFELSACKR